MCDTGTFGDSSGTVTFGVFVSDEVDDLRFILSHPFQQPLTFVCKAFERLWDALSVFQIHVCLQCSPQCGKCLTPYGSMITNREETQMGYYKNQAIDDWTPAPKPVTVHVALQETRRGRRYNEKKSAGLTPLLVISAMAFMFVAGLVLGVMA